MRKMAVSISAGKRRRSEGISRLTWILLRSAKPSTYHFSADVSPTSSSSGGCRRKQRERIARRSDLDEERDGIKAHIDGGPFRSESYAILLRTSFNPTSIYRPQCPRYH